MRCQIYESIRNLATHASNSAMPRIAQKNKFFIQIFSPSKLYMKLKTDILPRALWNSCEEIFRIENTKFILLKTLKFLMAFAM